MAGGGGDVCRAEAEQGKEKGRLTGGPGELNFFSPFFSLGCGNSVSWRPTKPFHPITPLVTFPTVYSNFPGIHTTNVIT